jgi:hypothetical protein
MADLQAAAETFANDLKNMNIAGLMMTFTPNGMGKAMAMQAQMAASGGPQPVTGVAVTLNGQDGEDHLVDIEMQNATGSAVISTRWKDVAGAWKVDDMALKA